MNNKTSQKLHLGSDALLNLALFSLADSSSIEKNFQSFSKKLIKQKGIYALLLSCTNDKLESRIEIAYPVASKKIYAALTKLDSQNLKTKKISRRANLYKLIKSNYRLENFDAHSVHIAQGISALIVCHEEISLDKNFRKLVSTVADFGKQLVQKIKLDYYSQQNKDLLKTNFKLSKSLDEQSKKKNETTEFPKRIVDLNSFPIVNVSKGKILSYNKALKRLLQCSDKYLRDINYLDIIHPKDRETIVNLAMKFILGQEKAVTVQVKILTKKNKARDILMSMHSIPDDNGVHQYTNCTIYDITDQTKLQEQLIKSQRQYKLLVDASPAGIIKTDSKGIIQFSSLRATEIFAYKKNQLIGKHLESLISKNNKDDFNSAIKSLDGTKTKYVGEFECNSKSKQKLFINCSLGLLLDKNKNPNGYLFAFNDATQEIEAKRKMLENQANLDSILNSTDDALLAYNKDYKILLVNKLAQNYISTLHNFKTNIGDTIEKKHRKEFINLAKYSKKKSSSIIKKIRKIKASNSDGKDRIIEITHTLIKDNKNKVLGVLETGKDITELAEKENLLVKSEGQYRFLVDNMNAGVSLIKPDGTHEFINQKGLDIFGIKRNAKKLNKHFQAFFHDDEFKRFAQIKKTIKPNIRISPEVFKAWNSKGETIYLELAISLAGDRINKEAPFLFSYTDVTKTVEARKELINRQATLNAVLDSTPNGIYAIDKELNIISVNRQAIKDFKYQVGVEIAVGKNLRDIIEPEMLKKWRDSYFDRVFKGESFKYTGPSAEKNYFLENSYAPVVTEDGDIIGCLEVSKDISEIKRQALALKESEQKYRLLIETSPAGIVQVNISGEVEFISNKGAEILGYEVEECIGMNSLQFVHPDDHSKILETLKNLIATQESKVSTGIGVTKDKRQIKLEGASKLVKNKEGKTEGLLIVFYDVTKREIAQQKLASTQAYFSKMYENTFDPIFVYNFEREKIIECNNAALKLFGYKTKKEIKSLNRFDLIPNRSKSFPDFQQHATLRKHSELVKNNKSINQNGVMLNKEGKELIVSVNVIPTKQNGSEAFVIIHDNTDRVRSFQALEKSKKEIEYERALYEAIIKNSFDGVDITEFTLIDDKYKNPKVVLRNSIMKKFLSNDQKSYSTLDELLEIEPEIISSQKSVPGKTSDNGSHDAKDIMKIIFSNDKQMLRFNLKAKDNKVYAVESSHNIINFYDHAYMIRNYRDITERIKQEKIINHQLDNLNDKNKELQGYIESNMQLENFAYIASHDLKAPLRSVSSFAHLLKRNCYDDLDEKGKKFLDIITESSMNMQWLIDDLLDYSRINTENIKKIKLDLKRLLSRIQRDLQLEIQKTNTKITINNLPDHIFADESMMIQLFQNLIHNAIKFVKKDSTPQITISATKKDEFHHFVVKDNGIGIAEENVSKIFGIFSKLHSNDVYKGTGLGLTICKTIIERHKGTIWVESKLNQGSEFHFTIQSTKE